MSGAVGSRPSFTRSGRPSFATALEALLERPRREATRRRCAPGTRPGRRDRNRRKASGANARVWPPERSPDARDRRPPERPVPLGVRRRLRALRATMSDDDQPDIPPSPVDARDASGGPLRAAAAGRPAAAAQAPAAARGRSRWSLLAIISTDLRDDDGARARAAEPRDRARVPDARATRCSQDRLGAAARHPHERPQPRPDPVRATSRRSCATRSSRSRTSASTRTPASTCAASAARSSQDVVKGGSRQGGSTITQQFVKNALEAQAKRTVFQKLRESALAYHLTRALVEEQDPHRVPELDLLRQRRLRRSSRPRGSTSRADPNHVGCGTNARPCAKELTAAEAALLAGVVANPTRVRPRRPPRGRDARGATSCWRRCSSRARSRAPSTTTPRSRRSPAKIVPADASTRRRPYFTTLGQPAARRAASAPRRAFEGGLRVRTTLDLDLQKAAQRAIDSSLPNPRRPGRRARRDRQRDRRGAGARQQHELPRPARSTSPRRASASPARPSSRSSSPRR